MIEAKRRNDEDEGWVKAFQEGEKEAFDRLVLKYQDRVFNMCYRFMGDRDDADDVAQETFIRVYRALPRFRGEAAFSSWLYRITVNCCKNKLSSLAFRMKRRMLRFKGEDEEGGAVDVANGRGDPGTLMNGEERRLLLQRAIDSLPPDQKALVVMRDIEGMPYEEIAELSGENLGTVKSKLSRARARLREKLTQVFPPP